MCYAAGRWFGLVACVSFLGVTTAANAALIALRAVAVNGTPLPEPVSKVEIEAGDEVTAELQISGWAGEIAEARGFQAKVFILESITSGDAGRVEPKGFRVDPDEGGFQCNTEACGVMPVVSCCRDDNDCNAPQTCVPNTRWIHFGLQAINAVNNLPDTAWEWGSLAFDEEGPADDGSVFYGGTLVLVASEDACGTFTYPLDPNPANTWLQDSDLEGTLIPVDTGDLQINVMCAPRIVNSCGDNCAIDARYPHDPFNPADNFAWDSVNLRFLGVDDVGAITCADLSTRFVGGPGTPPSCQSVTVTGADTVAVQLSGPIGLRRWTCVEYAGGQPGANEVCLGMLPGDVDHSQLFNGNDILALVDHVTNDTGLDLWQCDIDRDGTCRQRDLLAIVDLCVGANDFPFPWCGASINEGCPTASHSAPCKDLTLPQ